MCPLLDIGILDLRTWQLRVHREDFCVVTPPPPCPPPHTHTPAPCLCPGSSAVPELQCCFILSAASEQNRKCSRTTPCCMVLLHEAVSQCTYRDGPSLSQSKKAAGEDSGLLGGLGPGEECPGCGHLSAFLCPLISHITAPSLLGHSPAYPPHQCPSPREASFL